MCIAEDVCIHSADALENVTPASSIPLFVFMYPSAEPHHIGGWCESNQSIVWFRFVCSLVRVRGLDVMWAFFNSVDSVVGSNGRDANRMARHRPPPQG